MKEKTIYIADDGTEFDDDGDCIAYELQDRYTVALVKASKILYYYTSISENMMAIEEMLQHLKELTPDNMRKFIDHLLKYHDIMLKKTKPKQSGIIFCKYCLTLMDRDTEKRANPYEYICDTCYDTIAQDV